MAKNLSEKVFESRIDTVTVSKKHYSQLYNEREKYKKQSQVTTIGAILVGMALIAANILGYIAYTCSIGDAKAKIEEANAENQKLAEENNKQAVELFEYENERKQLIDRISFLAFTDAMYEEELEEQIIKLETPEVSDQEVPVTKVSAPIRNWQDYVNLFTIGQSVPLPFGIDTNTFRCMDYRTITTGSQYAIQQKSYTDYSNGLRYYLYNGEKYYTVALATAYGIDIGNAYEVTLANGATFKIMHAEYKHDIRYPSPTDYGDNDVNYDGENTISVIEFVYDWVNAPVQLISDGEANRWLGEGCDIYGDSCNIIKMVYLGKIWSAN